MGLLSSVGNLVGKVLNSVTGVKDTAQMSYDQSVALAQQQQANNVALWNMQNEYNTPAAQIARMASAGIDINPMTYAVGNGSMSSTAQNISPATYHAPNYSSPGNPLELAMSVMSGIKDLQRRDKENKLLDLDIKNYEHNHASPYKDIVTAVLSWLRQPPAPLSGEPGSKVPSLRFIKTKDGKVVPYKGFYKKDGSVDLSA